MYRRKDDGGTKDEDDTRRVETLHSTLLFHFFLSSSRPFYKIILQK